MVGVALLVTVSLLTDQRGSVVGTSRTGVAGPAACQGLDAFGCSTGLELAGLCSGAACQTETGVAASAWLAGSAWASVLVTAERFQPSNKPQAAHRARCAVFLFMIALFKNQTCRGGSPWLSTW